MKFPDQYKFCLFCENKYFRKDNEMTGDWKIRKFCSLTCSYKGKTTVKGRKHTKEAKVKIRKSAIGHKRNLGKSHSPETRKKISESKKKIKGKAHPRFGIKHTEKSKKLMSKNRKGLTDGKNNPNYIDGRSYTEYPKEFFLKREYIKNRDNFTCQNCGITEEIHKNKFGYKLDIHHIDYNKFNCNEDNLITLCRKCNCTANYNRDFWTKFYINKKSYSREGITCQV